MSPPFSWMPPCDAWSSRVTAGMCPVPCCQRSLASGCVHAVRGHVSLPPSPPPPLPFVRCCVCGGVVWVLACRAGIWRFSQPTARLACSTSRARCSSLRVSVRTLRTWSLTRRPTFRSNPTPPPPLSPSRVSTSRPSRRWWCLTTQAQAQAQAQHGRRRRRRRRKKKKRQRAGRESSPRTMRRMERATLPPRCVRNASSSATPRCTSSPPSCMARPPRPCASPRRSSLRHAAAPNRRRGVEALPDPDKRGDRAPVAALWMPAAAAAAAAVVVVVVVVANHRLQSPRRRASLTTR